MNDNRVSQPLMSEGFFLKVNTSLETELYYRDDAGVEHGPVLYLQSYANKFHAYAGHVGAVAPFHTDPATGRLKVLPYTP